MKYILLLELFRTELQIYCFTGSLQQARELEIYQVVIKFLGDR